MFEATMKAYRANRYDKLNRDLDRMTGAASLPVVGGLPSHIKGWGHTIALPFEMGWAAITGNASDPESIGITGITEDIQDTELGRDYLKFIQAKRGAVDLDAEKWGLGYRLILRKDSAKREAARHARNKAHKIRLPGNAAGEHGQPLVNAIVDAAALGGGAYLATGGDLSKIGELIPTDVMGLTSTQNSAPSIKS